MYARTAERAHQRGVVEVGGFLQKRRGASQRGAQFADIPAFHDGEAVADDPAVAHLHQHVGGAHAGLEPVLAHLQPAAGVQPPRQQLPLDPMAVGDACLSQPGEYAQEGIPTLDHHGVAFVDARERPVGEALVVVPRQERQPAGQQRRNHEEQPDAKSAPAHRHPCHVLEKKIIASGYLGRPGCRARHAPYPCRARSMPRALARVSASSRSGLESATMPAPVRKRRLPPSSSALRIRMLRSRSPSRLSQPIAPV